jgi:hypothetical protein
MMDDSKEVNPDLEKNSGIIFPGESLEPILGAATNVGDDTLEEAILVVECVASKEDKFAFSFLKN